MHAYIRRLHPQLQRERPGGSEMAKKSLKHGKKLSGAITLKKGK